MNQHESRKKSRFFSFRYKLIIMCLLLLAVPSIVIGLKSYYSATDNLNDLGARSLKNNVKLTIEMIDALHKYVEAGKISLEDAQEQVKQHILGPKQADGTRPINPNIDVGANGYLYIVSEQGIMLANPTAEGENSWERQGADGTFFMRDLIKKAIDGGDYTVYQLEDSKNPGTYQEKVAYAEMDPHWRWIVAASTFVDDFNAPADKVLADMLLILGISLIAGVIVTWIFAVRSTKPLIDMASSVNRVAEGDLTVEPLQVKSRDEIGQLAHDFNAMAANLRGLISHLGENAEQVAATSEQLTASAEQTSKATEQIAVTMQEVAAGTDEQVRTVEDTVQTMNIMAGRLQHISANSEQVSSTVEEASQAITSGNQAIHTAVAQMSSISTTVNGLASSIKMLGQRSAEISNIIEVITSIAEQTNLLALNAAIEAARAGEHGRGFAVVADEVRKLAEQSAQSTKQITQLIASIQNDTNQAVEAMETTTTEVAAGIEVVNVAGHSFQEILSSIQAVSQQIQEVTVATVEMNAGAEQITHSIEGIASTAETTASGTQNVSAAAEEQLASMEEITSSASSLSQMAEDLQALVQQFKV
ncbi:methyl-accepting chemotaxis protein [Brevibacillus nitrificans]|uniref:methyl-accepting chemotaxis protein n=1 Tax=Brevibacillus nitrificans TaxID=651560 RepID=UPI002631DCC6|nr:methyl-accepting chemotaxis protein [Brevibacillus nitrificans]